MSSAPAQAGTVDATQGVVFTAAPGETNNVTITQSGASFTIVDNWPLTALGPCSSTDMFTAVCTPTSEVVTAFLSDLDDTAVIVVDHPPGVEGGDGADTVTISAGLPWDEYLVVNGGPGDDNLADEGEFGSVLDGGPGNDRISTHTVVSEIYGSDGNDLIDARNGFAASAYGGRGKDRLLGGPVDDFLDGGRGLDTLIGGAGSDSLFGWVGNDVIRGGRGQDQLWGWHGDDLIVGGRGRDRGRGGEGNDTFHMRDGYSDRVNGSHGFDRAAIDRFDRVRLTEKLL